MCAVAAAAVFEVNLKLRSDGQEIVLQSPFFSIQSPGLSHILTQGLPQLAATK